MQSRVSKSIDELNAQQWNALGGGCNPFLRHEFFAALEHTQCVGAGTGWEPCYFTLADEAGLAAAAPAFIKTHSYGEFVFDFAWAQAYARIGRRYYPKLSVAVPFTQPSKGKHEACPGGAEVQDRAPIRRTLGGLEPFVPLPRQEERDHQK